MLHSSSFCIIILVIPNIQRTMAEEYDDYSGINYYPYALPKDDHLPNPWADPNYNGISSDNNKGYDNSRKDQQRGFDNGQQKNDIYLQSVNSNIGGQIHNAHDQRGQHGQYGQQNWDRGDRQNQQWDQPHPHNQPYPPNQPHPNQPHPNQPYPPNQQYDKVANQQYPQPNQPSYNQNPYGNNYQQPPIYPATTTENVYNFNIPPYRNSFDGPGVKHSDYENSDFHRGYRGKKERWMEPNFQRGDIRGLKTKFDMDYEDYIKRQEYEKKNARIIPQSKLTNHERYNYKVDTRKEMERTGQVEVVPKNYYKKQMEYVDRNFKFMEPKKEKDPPSTIKKSKNWYAINSTRSSITGSIALLSIEFMTIVIINMVV